MVSEKSDASIATSTQETRWGHLYLLARLEWIVALVLSATVLFLLIARATHAGALDRDECDALHLARLPNWADLLKNLQLTAFPILFPATVRSYAGLLGASDFSLRCFGLAVCVLMLSVAWFHSRRVNGDVPLLLPALIGLNANFLTTGGWLRGYGLGSLLAVVAFFLTEKLLLQATARRRVAVLVAFLVATQVLFFNAVLVPAIGFSGMIVLLANKERRWMWFLAAALAICAIFYVPYVVTVLSEVSKWADTV